MLFSNFYPFIIVILQTLIQHIRMNVAKKVNSVKVLRITNIDEEVEGSADTVIFSETFLLHLLEVFCRLWLPALGTCFVIGYWTFGYLK